MATSRWPSLVQQTSTGWRGKRYYFGGRFEGMGGSSTTICLLKMRLVFLSTYRKIHWFFRIKRLDSSQDSWDRRTKVNATNDLAFDNPIKILQRTSMILFTYPNRTRADDATTPWFFAARFWLEERQINCVKPKNGESEDLFGKFLLWLALPKRQEHYFFAYRHRKPHLSLLLPFFKTLQCQDYRGY